MTRTEAHRVLIVHNRYRSELPSGEDRVVEQESELLASNGHSVIRFERRSSDIEAMSLSQKVRIPVEVPWNARVRSALRAVLIAERPDVVHVHNTFPLVSPSVFAACADVGVPVVATLHNYYLICPVGTIIRDGEPCQECVGGSVAPSIRHGCYRGSRLATVPLAANLFVNRRRWWFEVDRLLCVSQAQRSVLIAGGVPAERLHVKHHFVADPGRQRRGIGKHVLYLGRMSEEKGLRLLMDAWGSRSDSAGTRVPLVLAGAGPLADEVRSWGAARDDVRFLGLRTAAECRDLTLDATAVVAPSVARETFGLTIAEAMACGVPVVAAGHGGFAELVDDGVSGLLHEPRDAGALGNALERLLRDPARNLEMGRNARRRYEAAFGTEAGLAALRAEYAAAIEARTSRLPLGQRAE